ncbi:MAG: 4-hydroxy-tetrahydrodipicolinate reductase [Defluviitaleaceae bacterium]|nr:4-hydroxy-tetrahydrodipicolinate reductase [Defluviitaleaceae bacterium]
MEKTRIIVHGLGRLGLCVAENAAGGVVAAVDVAESAADFPVYGSFGEVKEAADVIVDCSHAEAIPALLTEALRLKMPLVICTTGFSGDTFQKIAEAANELPIFVSSNMSLGVNLISKLAAMGAQALDGAGFDIEILESHHNKKLDAPSGTALFLADSINNAMEGRFRYVHDRSKELSLRQADEIGISAIRGGSVVGEHTVFFMGDGEVVEITHRALDRGIFARGALRAAEFIVGKPPRLYTMTDLLKE